MPKVKDVVSWIMLDDDKILKLKKANKTYNLSDPVVEFIKKNKLGEKEDFAVEVEVTEALKEGEDGTITSLKEINSDEKTETAESSNTSQPNDTITKELTVHGVSVAKKGVKFKEEDVWYTLGDDIDPQTFKDTCTGQLTEVYIQETDQGNDIISGFKELEVEKKDVKGSDKPPKEKTKYNNASKSIEAQASLKCAKVIVANMVDKDSKPDFVLRLITKISNHAYQTLQDLKNKE